MDPLFFFSFCLSIFLHSNIIKYFWFYFQTKKAESPWEWSREHFPFEKPRWCQQHQYAYIFTWTFEIIMKTESEQEHFYRHINMDLLGILLFHLNELWNLPCSLQVSSYYLNWFALIVCQHFKLPNLYILLGEMYEKDSLLIENAAELPKLATAFEPCMDLKGVHLIWSFKRLS